MSKPKYPCDYPSCGKVFAGKCYLNIHLGAHKDLENGLIFKCKICEKILKNRRNLHLHIKSTHINPKPKPIWKPSAPLTSNQRICYFCGKYIAKHLIQDHLRLHLRETPYNCSLCVNAYSSSIKLWKHQKKYHSDYFKQNQEKLKTPHRHPHACEVEGCKEIFSSRNARNYHFNQKHCSWPCPLCNKCQKTKSALNCHISRFHTNEKPYRCREPGCEKSYKSSAGLKAHTKFIHATRSDKVNHDCEMCLKSFRFEKSLQSHVNMTHLRMGKIYSCPHCDQEFRLKPTFQAHVATHTGVWLFQCERCPSKFASKGRLTQHAQSHAEKGEECHICGQKFVRRGDLASHIKDLHPESPRPRNFQCPICKKSFYTNKCLVQHTKTHTEGRGALCYFCGTSKTSLVEHFRVHTGEKPFHCRQVGCSYSTGSIGGLKYHQQKHNGQVFTRKKSKCYFCQKEVISVNLPAHVRSHTAEVPYKCTLCSRSYFNNPALCSHITTFHTKETPFKCDHCGKQFAFAYALKTHVSRVHLRLQRFSCFFCSFTCYSKTSFQDHMLRKHTEGAQKPYCCKAKECGRKFFTGSELRRHAASVHDVPLAGMI